MSLRTVAWHLDVAPSIFTRLIRGDSDISPEMALKLSKVFGRSAGSWVKMQINFELWKAKKRVDLNRVQLIYTHAR